MSTPIAPTEERPAPPRSLEECHRYIAELEETESALSEEVLKEGQAHRHWKAVCEDLREALEDTRRYAQALEQDREIDRLAAYKRGREHADKDDADPAQDAALPAIDPAGAGLQTRWFRTRADALAYASNAGFRQQPMRRRVWVDLAWHEEWSLRAPSAQAQEPQP